MTTEQEKNQRSFDMAAVALVKQGKPSGVMEADDGFQCLYRGPEGTRCAAGWLFEGEAGVDFEEEDRCTQPLTAALLESNGHNVNFVAELQEAHDIPAVNSPTASWLSDWESRMRKIAATYVLSTAVLDAALAARVVTSNV